ncbi:MAG: cyclic lactone autoinducer peptide [Bacilli bacterium]|nr:cyclic lactone autoinducer peptide [Bacilli bacterium]
MSFIVSLLEGLGSMFANAGSTTCLAWWWDEPKCPKSLIK